MTRGYCAAERGFFSDVFALFHRMIVHLIVRSIIRVTVGVAMQLTVSVALSCD